uniref:Uncharacterized protein n=2 Tax=Canis lupus familiaris TaxID=9615 RepID=A0A8I3PV49_CANLF
LYFRTLSSVPLAQFGGQFFSLCLFLLGSMNHLLCTQNVASPVTADLIISVIVIGPDTLHQLSQSDSIAGLPVAQMVQPGLPLFTAQGKVEDSQLSGIHSMCSHYQLSLLIFTLRW